jgi:thermitase
MRFASVAKKWAFAPIVLAVILGTASAQVTSTPAGTQTVMTDGSPSGIRAGHILVRFKTPPSQDVLNQLNAAFGARVIGTIAGIGVTHLQVPPESGPALLSHLRSRPDVEFAEFDSLVQAIVQAASSTATFQPNDPYYSTAYASSHYGNIAQWGPQAVSAPGAWGITLGDRSIVIAIVDTGVDDTHPDLASKIVGEYSYVGNSAKDGFGHGTHVAGIAAAATNNNTGVAGMCPNCGILSVKVLNDQGSGNMSDVASGITYAASHGARVISMSLGGGGRSSTLQSALAYAIANNALPVCAMGNDSSGSNTPEPAYWHDCLSVIATDQNGTKASFSNYGMKADVAAPGVAILSTMPTYPVTLTTTYGYKTNYDALSGTSMATPMVSGIAGLVLSQNPSLTPTQVAGIIEASAGDGVSWTPNLAFGIVNAFKAVSSAIHSDYAAPAANLISPAEGATVSGLVTVQAAPTDSATVHHVDFVQNGTRFMQVLTGASTTTGTGKNAVTTPAWTVLWPSTTVFNNSFTVAVSAVDVFGNTSPDQNRDFSVQNKLVSQSWTQHLCYPATSSCPSQVWDPVTTGVATEAATHLQGTVSFSRKDRSAMFFVWQSRAGFGYFCGAFGAVDCYPPLTLVPDSNKSYSNNTGTQITTSGTAIEADVQWTLTYPQ